MDDISPSELKTILHSKRANLYYLQHCRVLVNGGRVEYVTDEGRHSHYWNIPIANTTSLLLGTGTSITQAAMRELARAGVLVGFCGGGGTPLFSANEVDVEVSWLTPQSEYRPTEYLQLWVGFWFDEENAWRPPGTSSGSGWSGFATVGWKIAYCATPASPSMPPRWQLPWKIPPERWSRLPIMSIY